MIGALAIVVLVVAAGALLLADRCGPVEVYTISTRDLPNVAAPLPARVTTLPSPVEDRGQAAGIAA